MPAWVNALFVQPGALGWVSELILLNPNSPGTHYIDCYVQTFSYVRLAGQIQAPAESFVKLAGTVAAPQLSSVNLAATIKVGGRTPVNLAGTIQIKNRIYARLAGAIQNPTYRTHNVDCEVSGNVRQYVQLNGTIQGIMGPGPCGSFPDASYVNLRGWVVAQGDSIQMPGSGFSRAEDFLSSQTALAAYKPMSVFILDDIALIITAFTTGVLSWQTRTRSWLRRVDAAPNGILVTNTTNVHTLPNGAIITTNTQVTQNQDVVTTVITITNSATPTRTSKIVTVENKFGQTSTTEIDTENINGVVTTTETTNVFSRPPDTENIQPLKVTTLDGVQHYQFFGQENTEWAGGDAEGTTKSVTQTQISGLTKTIDQVVDTPDGKHIETKTSITGAQSGAGTTTTDTTQEFNGTQTTVHKVVTNPDGSQLVSDITTNNLTGDSTQVDVETVTDEFGQVTVTTTTTETVTANNQTTVTKTVVVNKGGVITTDQSVNTTNDFEDDIVNQKVQVIFIQEFTITCVIDEMSMFALWEINETHQKNFALLELFGQQLSNATLSFLLRQSLIDQFNTANSCTSPVPLQANGRVYNVVFAPSASAFRAKYIPGTEPHVYELQLILQERSNLVSGTKGFF